MHHPTEIDVFVSYARADCSFVRELIERLRAAGLAVWSDTTLAGGDEWRAVIVEAIERARIMLVVYSHAAQASSEVAKEVALAAQNRLLLVPLRIELVQPSGPLLYEMARLNWIDCFPGDPHRLEQVVQAVAKLARAVESKPAQTAFARSLSAWRLSNTWLRRTLGTVSVAGGLCLLFPVLLFASYDLATHFVSNEAAAGISPIVTFWRATFVSTLGSPLLAYQALRRIDQPWMGLVLTLAIASCLSSALLVRNVSRSIRARLLRLRQRDIAIRSA